jgi:divalent metal cation (Fe/Co/Zn/Cd) transporter
VYEGVVHIRRPEELRDPIWNYVVLAVALVAEGCSWWIAIRKLLQDRTSKVNVFRAFRRSKDPTVFVVVGEDTAALLGILVAAAGVYLSHQLRAPWIDGAASIVIGLILAAVAVMLVYESRALIVGETADPILVHEVQAIVEGDAAVQRARPPLTMQMSPDDVLLNMDIEFRHELSAAEVIAAIDRIEAAIRARHPSVSRIFLEMEGVRASVRDARPPAAPGLKLV